MELTPLQEGCGVSLWGKCKIMDLSYAGRQAELGVEADSRQGEGQYAQKQRPPESLGEGGERQTGARCVDVEGLEDWGDHAAGKLLGQDSESGGSHHRGEE